jgi:hypothetical protein
MRLITGGVQNPEAATKGGLQRCKMISCEAKAPYTIAYGYISISGSMDIVYGMRGGLGAEQLLYAQS